MKSVWCPESQLMERKADPEQAQPLGVSVAFRSASWVPRLSQRVQPWCWTNADAVWGHKPLSLVFFSVHQGWDLVLLPPWFLEPVLVLVPGAFTGTFPTWGALKIQRLGPLRRPTSWPGVGLCPELLGSPNVTLRCVPAVYPAGGGGTPEAQQGWLWHGERKPIYGVRKFCHSRQLILLSFLATGKGPWGLSYCMTMLL